MQFVDITWADVRPDDEQPRRNFDDEHLEALEISMRTHGQITPVRVRPDPNGVTAFVLVDGECRWRVGRKLHEAEPDNPLFARLKAFVADDEAADVLVVQFLANSGAGHTPAEKAAVMERLLASGVARNKLRATLGIPKAQFRQLREFVTAPQWLRSYGEPQTARVAVLDERGAPQRDEAGHVTTTTRTVSPLPLAHLAILARYATKLVAWDQAQQATHPDGTHANVARKVLCDIAEKAQREGWPLTRVTKRCSAAVERAMGRTPSPPQHPEQPDTQPSPFVRNANGALRIPVTDPAQLSVRARRALADELERLLSALRSAGLRDASALHKEALT